MLAECTAVLDASRCMDTNSHKQSQPSQQKPARSQHVELLRGLARPVPRYAVTVICRNQQQKTKKIFCPPKKRAKLKTKKDNENFRKVVISD